MKCGRKITLNGEKLLAMRQDRLLARTDVERESGVSAACQATIEQRNRPVLVSTARKLLTFYGYMSLEAALEAGLVLSNEP